MEENVTVFTEEVEPFKATVEIPVEAWIDYGPQYEAIIEVHGIFENGITEATFNEEKMSEINRSYTLKIINDILSGEPGTLFTLSTKDNSVEAIWFGNEPPKISIIFDISQLPFK